MIKKQPSEEKEKVKKVGDADALAKELETSQFKPVVKEIKQREASDED